MVLDNADDSRVFFTKHTDNQQPLAAYLPQGDNRSILVTSRSQDAATQLTGSHNKIRAVKAIDEAQALQLLRCKLGKEDHNDPTATHLIRALNCVPLAITQAAAYIVQRAPRVSPSKYLTRLQHNKKKKAGLLGRDVGDLRRDASASNSIIATWQLTFNAVRQERASAADLLGLMSFFSPHGIPDWILRGHKREENRKSSDGGSRRGDKDGESRNDDGGGSSDSSSENSDRSSDSDGFEDDLHLLRQYSLVATTLDEGILEMHPMVQFCSQEWLSSTGRALAAKRAFFRVLAEKYPLGTYENWARCRALDPHIGPFEVDEPKSDGEGKDMAAVLTWAGYYRSMIGLHKAAEGILRKAVRLRERLLGADHPDTLTSVSNLGEVLGDQGRYEEAEKMHRRAIGAYEKALGADHPSTLTSVNNLGLVLHRQGRYEEAVQMHRRALEGREKMLGAEHPDTLTSIWHLAHLLRGKSRLKESESLYDRAWEGFHAVLGPDHPHTVACGGQRLSLKQEMEGQFEDQCLGELSTGTLVQ